MSFKSLGTITAPSTRRDGDMLFVYCCDSDKKIKIRITRGLVRSLAYDLWSWLKEERADVENTEKVMKGTP